MRVVTAGVGEAEIVNRSNSSAHSAAVSYAALSPASSKWPTICIS